MSSLKLNDPAAPMYRRNYRTHLALEKPADTLVINDEAICASAEQSLITSIQADDRAPLLSTSISSSQGNSNNNIPIDHYSSVKYAFLLLGLVSLLPWNFFINASKYWMFKFRDVNSKIPYDDPKHRTRLQTEFFSMISIVSCVPYLIVLYFSAFINKYVPQKLRNIGALVIVTVLFSSVTAMVTVDTDGWQEGFYQLTLIQMFLVASFGAWYQGGVMGLASIFPKEYTHVCIIGQSVGGVLASFVEIIVLLLGTSPKVSALLYFGFALIVLLASIFAILYIQNLTFFKYYLKQADSPSSSSVTPEEFFDIRIRTKLLFRKTWRFGVTLFLIYIATFALFPGILVHVKPATAENTAWANLFSPIACFLVFNIGDLVGRMMCSYLGFPAEREQLLLGLSILRLMLTPLFFLCNIAPRVSYLPVVFDNDLVFLALNALFATSNGYLTSVTMVYAPKKVDCFLQERVGTLMVAILASGMSLGSVFSLVFVRIFFHV